MEDVVIEVLIESGIAEIEIIEGIWNIGISDRRETIKEAKGGVYVSKLNILQQLTFMITLLYLCFASYKYSCKHNKISLLQIAIGTEIIQEIDLIELSEEDIVQTDLLP